MSSYQSLCRWQATRRRPEQSRPGKRLQDACFSVIDRGSAVCPGASEAERRVDLLTRIGARQRPPGSREHMMSEAIVVIGAGQAGAQLAMSLRQGGYAVPIRLICDEPYLPYQRPPLSKKFLAEYRDPDCAVPAAGELLARARCEHSSSARRSARSIRRCAASRSTDGREIDYDTAGVRHRHLGAHAAGAGRRPARRVLAAPDRRRGAAAARAEHGRSASSSWAAAISGSKSPPSRARRARASPCWKPKTACSSG